MSEESYKSRRLSTFEFFEIVQVEYICAKLRAKIYLKSKDKEYWNRVAEGKKRKIEEISERNQLPNIFTDSDCEAALNRRVYGTNSFPIFIYKDDTHKLSQEYYDYLYYYSEGTHVRFDLGLGVQIGIIDSYKPFDKVISVKLQDSEEVLQISTDKVLRIL